MQTNTNPVLDTYQQQIDATRHIAEVVFDGVDRMERLMMDTTRNAFDERMKYFQALAAVRDPQGVTALNSAFFSHTPEKMLKTNQELMKIISQTQDEINQTMLQHRAGLNGRADQETVNTKSENPLLDNQSLTSIYSMWNKAVKDSVALTTGAVSSVLSAAKKDAIDVKAVQKPVTKKTAKK